MLLVRGEAQVEEKLDNHIPRMFLEEYSGVNTSEAQFTVFCGINMITTNNYFDMSLVF